MTIRLITAKGAFAAAAAAMTLAGVFATPQVASAQPSGYDGQGASYSDTCAQNKTNRQVAGGVIGAIGGAVLGSNLASGGGRTGGALIGGAVGAAAGAGIGGATATCDDQYYDQASNGPPPPPPPPGYDDRDNGYRDGGYRGGYDNGVPPGCAMVESRVRFPDGSIERDPVQACRGPDGHWRLAQ
jgi:hypothetical protein